MIQFRLGPIRLLDKNENGIYDPRQDQAKVDPGCDKNAELESLRKTLSKYGIGSLEGQNLSKIAFFYHYSKVFESAAKGKILDAIHHAQEAETAASDRFSGLQYAGFYENGIRISLKKAMANGALTEPLENLGNGAKFMLFPLLSPADVTLDAEDQIEIVQTFLDDIQDSVARLAGPEAAAIARIRFSLAMLAKQVKSVSLERRLEGDFGYFLHAGDMVELLEGSVQQAMQQWPEADLLAQELLVTDFATEMAILAHEGLESGNCYSWDNAIYWTGRAFELAGYRQVDADDARKGLEDFLLQSSPSKASQFYLIKKNFGLSLHDDE